MRAAVDEKFYVDNIRNKVGADKVYARPERGMG